METQILKWMSEAGEIALQYFRNVSPELKENKTYVTIADKEVQKFLAAKLEENFPEFGIIAEEDNLRKEAADQETYFTVDPIDGTASFVSGLPIWGIAIGIIRSGVPQAGYFFMPTVQDIFYTNPSGNVFRNRKAIHLQKQLQINRETVLYSVSRLHQSFQVNPNFPGKIRCLGSIVAHLCYAATGSADAVLVNKANLWDIVPGLAMLLRQNGVGRFLDGSLFEITPDLLNGGILERPVLFGQEHTIDYFLDQVTFTNGENQSNN